MILKTFIDFAFIVFVFIVGHFHLILILFVANVIILLSLAVYQLVLKS